MFKEIPVRSLADPWDNEQRLQWPNMTRNTGFAKRVWENLQNAKGNHGQRMKRTTKQLKNKMRISIKREKLSKVNRNLGAEKYNI